MSNVILGEGVLYFNNVVLMMLKLKFNNGSTQQISIKKKSIFSGKHIRSDK